ncbi:MAG: hypothetical protein F6K09_30700 [Merismopedia sp. SIO2A8]|nr:hypothetical protein [Merismopedia sp. SIO2A8]
MITTRTPSTQTRRGHSDGPACPDWIGLRRPRHSRAGTGTSQAFGLHLLGASLTSDLGRPKDPKAQRARTANQRWERAVPSGLRGSRRRSLEERRGSEPLR